MLATEDMFLYEQAANFETNIPALENMLRNVKSVPGIETHANVAHHDGAGRKGSDYHRATDAFDCSLTRMCNTRNRPIQNKRMTDPIIGLETGSSRLFDIFMKGKAYPYKAHQWRDVVLKGMEILNKHNWFPFCTFIIGLPGETDEDTKESLEPAIRIA